MTTRFLTELENPFPFPLKRHIRSGRCYAAKCNQLARGTHKGVALCKKHYRMSETPPTDPVEIHRWTDDASVPLEKRPASTTQFDRVDVLQTLVDALRGHEDPVFRTGILLAIESTARKAREEVSR